MELVNRSLSQGLFLKPLKEVQVSPILKKADSDINDPASYRLISRVPVLSKILERIVEIQLQQHIDEFTLLPPQQSSFRKHHSTGTALLKIVSDSLNEMDNGNAQLMAFFDLSAAFESFDHQTLLSRLQISYGLNDVVLQWFQSFLTQRTTYFNSSVSHLNECGIPQGFVL